MGKGRALVAETMVLPKWREYTFDVRFVSDYRGVRLVKFLEVSASGAAFSIYAQMYKWTCKSFY